MVSSFAAAEYDTTGDGGSVPVVTKPSGSGATASVDGPLGNNDWFVGAVNVTLTAGSESVLQYRVNGGAWTVYSGPFKVDADKRDHRVEFGSQGDVAKGRTGSATFSIDASDPWTHVNLTSILNKGRPDGRPGNDSSDDDEDDDDQAYDSETGEKRNVRGGDDDEDDDDDKGRHLGWFRNVTLVRLRGTDNLSGHDDTFYRVDNGSWQEYQGAFFVKEEGNHTIEYWSKDRAGNEEPVRTIRFGHDASAPDSNSTVENPPEDGDGSGDGGSDDGGSGDDGSSGGDNSTEDPGTAPGPVPKDGWYDQEVVLALDAVDNVSGVAVIKYSTNNASYENYSLPILYSVDGVYVTTYYSTDLAGNSEEPQNVTVRVDSTPPSLRDVLTGPEGELGWYRGNVTLGFEAADATSGVAVLETSVDGSAWQAFVQDLEFTEEGAYDAVARAQDVAGNTVTRTVRVGVDWTAPWVTAAVSGERSPDGYFVGDAKLTIDATDNVSGVALTEFGLDNGSFQKYSNQVTIATDGQHTVRFRSTDTAGNPALTQELEFTVDALPPVTKLRVNDAPAPWRAVAPTNDTAPSLTLDATDAVSGVNVTYYRVDGGPVQVYSGAFTVSGEGPHVVTYWSEDKAGFKELERSTTVLIDTVAPTSASNVTGEAGENGWFVSAVTLELTAEDDSSGVAAIHYSVNGGAFQEYAQEIVLGDGEYTIAFRAQDAAGNLEALNVLSVLVDSTAPATSAAVEGEEGKNGWFTSDVVVNLTGSDATSGVNVTFARVNGGEAFLVDAPLSFAEDGVHVVEYWSVDVAGNVEDASEVTVKVDRAAPDVKATVHGNRADTSGSTYVGPVAVVFESTDETSGVDAVYYRVNGGKWFKTPAWPLPFWNKGDYVVEYYAVDAAGIASAVQQVSFTVVYPTL